MTELAAWPPGSGEMARRIREYDWAATPLGPIAHWPQSLKTAVELMLDSAQPVYIGWGPELISLYNEGYVPIAGDKHPGSLGQPYRIMWAEIWDDVRPIIEGVARDGESHIYHDRPVPVAGRPDRPMSWFTTSVAPIRDENGKPAGVYVVALETTERVLAESAIDERYRTLFETMGQGFVELELLHDEHGQPVDLLYLELNPAFERQFGIPVSRARGRRASEFFPDFDPAWVEAFDRVARSGDPERIEHTLDGRWFEVNAYPAPHGRVMALYEDVSERKRAEAALRESEERQAFLLELTDTLRTLSDPHAIQHAAMKLLAERLDVMRAGYMDADPDQDTMIMAAYFDRGAPSTPERVRLSDYGPEISAEFRAGRTQCVRDAMAESITEEQRGAYRAIHTRAWIISPLLKDGRLIAIVGVVDRNARDWTPGEIDLVVDIAERTWDAVERARAETALRESEARLTAAFQSVPVGVAVLNLEGKIVIANEEYRRFLPTGTIPSRDPANAARWRAWDEHGSPIAPTDYPGARALRGEWVVPGLEMLFKEEDGREIWTRVATVPIRDDAGQMTGMASVISDIDAAKRSAEALRESEAGLAAELSGTELLRRLSEHVVSQDDADKLHEDILSAAIELTRADAGTIQLYDPASQSLVLLVTRNIASHMIDHFQRVDGASNTACGKALRNGVRTFVDFDEDLTDDACRMHVEAGYRSAQATPLVSRSGAPLGMLNTHWGEPRHRPDERELRFLDLLARQAADLIEQRQAQEALRQGEERFREFGEASQDILWIRDAETLQWTYLTPAFETIYGLSRQEATKGENYRNWLGLVVPEDRDRVAATVAKVRAGEHVTFEYRVRRPVDGEIRWLRNTDFPILGASGLVQHIGGIGTDITQRKRDEERLRHSERHAKLLLAELQHRVRNILAMIRSVARRSADGATDVADYCRHLEGRITAMARTQALLTRGVGAAVDLQNYILDELNAQAAEPDRITLDGPDVALPPKPAEVLALTIHELATNSVKYGALSSPDGRIDIRWATLDGDDAPRLSLIWSESGVAINEAPKRRGLGYELITERVPYELHGEGTMEFTPDGVVCTLEFPLIGDSSILQTDANLHEATP